MKYLHSVTAGKLLSNGCTLDLVFYRIKLLGVVNYG